MGSRLLHTAAANLVLVGALAAFHVSCMPPGMHLHFAGESGATSKRRMRICDGRAEMEIRSFSSIGVYCERYELSLYVRVKLLQKGHTISIAPEGLAALVGDSVMIVHHNYPTHRVDSLSDREFRVDANFELRQDLRLLRSRGSLPVRIAMDRFIFVDGEPAIIDTVRAIERQWCE